MPASRHGPWAVLLLAVAAATGTGAQTNAPADPDAPPRAEPGRVLSDVQPLPAEDRESHGAVVLEQSPVRAQKDTVRTERAGTPAAVGRNAARVVERARDWNDVRDAGASQVPAGEASGGPPSGTPPVDTPPLDATPADPPR